MHAGGLRGDRQPRRDQGIDEYISVTIDHPQIDDLGITSKSSGFGIQEDGGWIGRPIARPGRDLFPFPALRTLDSGTLITSLPA